MLTNFKRTSQMRRLAALVLAPFFLTTATGAVAQTPNSSSGTGTAQVWMLAGTQKRALTATPVENAKTAVDSGQSSGANSGAMTLASIAAAVIPFGAIVATALSLFTHHHPKGPTQRDTWALSHARSNLSIASSTPAFEVAYADLPGVDPSAYEPVLLKLSPTSDNWRVVTQTNRDIANSGELSGPDFSEHRVDVDVTPLDHGHARIAPKSALEPGEYGVALRPLKREASSHEMAGMPGMPMPGQAAAATPLWQTVWDFAVQGTPPAANAQK